MTIVRSKVLEDLKSSGNKEFQMILGIRSLNVNRNDCLERACIIGEAGDNTMFESDFSES